MGPPQSSVPASVDRSIDRSIHRYAIPRPHVVHHPVWGGGSSSSAVTGHRGSFFSSGTLCTYQDPEQAPSTGPHSLPIQCLRSPKNMGPLRVEFPTHRNGHFRKLLRYRTGFSFASLGRRRLDGCMKRGIRHFLCKLFFVSRRPSHHGDPCQTLHQHYYYTCQTNNSSGYVFPWSIFES